MPKSRPADVPARPQSKPPGLIDPRRLEQTPRPEQPRPGEWGPAEGPAPAPALASVGSVQAERRRRKEQAAADGGPDLTSESSALHADPEALPEPSERKTPSRPPRPILASEILRRELAPTTPASRLSRAGAALLGMGGAAAVPWLAADAELALPVAGALLLVGLLGILPASYGTRAAALVVLSASTGALIVLRQRTNGDPLESVLLRGGVVILATALWFRSWHRGSVLARLLVLMGMGVCAAWLWRAGALRGLTSLPMDWQLWAPRVLDAPLGLLLMLSLLALMGSESTGGCAVWATALLAWYVAREWLDLFTAYWPVGAQGPVLERVNGELALPAVCLPLLVVLLSIGLAQLLAWAMGARTQDAARG
jgi:hypothetical protein